MEGNQSGLRGTEVCDCPRDSYSRKYGVEFRELYEKVPLFSKLHELEGMVQFCSPLFLDCLTYGQDSELFVKKKKNQNVMFLKPSN